LRIMDFVFGLLESRAVFLAREILEKESAAAAAK